MISGLGNFLTDKGCFFKAPKPQMGLVYNEA